MFPGNLWILTMAMLLVESDRIEKSWAGKKLLIQSLYHSDRIFLESGPGHQSCGIDLIFPGNSEVPFTNIVLLQYQHG